MFKKFILSIGILFFIGIFIYSFFVEPEKLKVNKYIIKDQELRGIKIVFASDFHIKPHQQKRLEKIVKAINDEEPDIVLSVGDYVSGHSEFLTMPIEKISKELGNIKSKNGVYSSIGNHDKYLGVDKIRTALEQNNITVLNNENTKVLVNGKEIYIAGIQYKVKDISLIDKSLYGTKSPVIMLTHSPDEFYKIPSGVNLILAGHTHGGQVVLPIVGAILTGSKYKSKFLYGLIEEDNKKMIVTKGLGVSILPFRFNAIPEIVVIEFV